jgi:hypothetical protein
LPLVCAHLAIAVEDPKRKGPEITSFEKLVQLITIKVHQSGSWKKDDLDLNNLQIIENIPEEHWCNNFLERLERKRSTKSVSVDSHTDE